MAKKKGQGALSDNVRTDRPFIELGPTLKEQPEVGQVPGMKMPGVPGRARFVPIGSQAEREDAGTSRAGDKLSEKQESVE